VQTLRETPEAPVRSVGQGARLDPIETLRAGVGLADALSYLHRNGVAHLHVSPETLIVQQGRAYLTGLEDATLLDWNTSEASQLFARDANFLARALGALSGFADAMDQDAAPETSPAEALTGEGGNNAGAERAVRTIATQGVAESYTSPEEVRSACGVALNMLGFPSDTLAPERPDSETPLTRLMFVTGSASTIGRVRSENQDAMATTIFDLQDDVTLGGAEAPMGVFLVSDGMGGEAHGEIASRIVARAVIVEMARHFTLPKLLWPILSINPDDGAAQANQQGATPSAKNPAEGEAIDSLAQALTQAVAEANRQTRVFARQLGAATGATLTAIATSGAHAALAHLGDSRAYLLREMQFIRLTEDHSLLARMEAMDHPLLSDASFQMPRSVLYRSVGQDDEAPPDMLEFTLNPEDRLLLCSDGLWDELSDQTLGQELALANDPQVCAERLVALANAAGGHDNSTAVVVFVSAAVPLELTAEDAASTALSGSQTPDDASGAETSANA
ncbi:MAG TPA: protein phosphatase 2C domain-containing protein, partial [Ktedonobacterales bacterium]|nr:protein phosphatase 2C domain-containing protein [Ktedonobacterales bacterium]